MPPIQGLARTLRRKIASVTHVDNTILSVELPKEHLYHTLHVRIQGSMVVSGALTLKENGIINLLKNINLKIDGRLSPKNASAVLFHFGAMYENQQRPRFQDTLTTVATHTFYCDVPIRFKLPNKVAQPYGFLLNSDPFKTFQLFLTTGSTADVFSAGTATLSGLTYEIWSEEIVPNKIPVLDLNQENQQDVTWTAANSKLQYELPLGNLYKRLLFRVEDNGVQSDTKVTKVRVLVNGTEILHEMTWAELLDFNQNYYHITPATGIAILEFDERGGFSEVIPSGNLSTFKLEFEVIAATAGKINILPMELVINPANLQG